MSSLPNNLKNISLFLERLPGIGEKTANRLTFFLLNLPEEDLKEFAENVSSLKSKTKLFLQTLEPLKDSKVKIKMALSGDSTSIKEMENKLSIKIKKTEIDSKFFIIDRKELIFYLSRNGKDVEDIAVWLNSDFFAESFASLFEKAIGEK
jgi:recombinational DNA repair protein RecR